MQARVEQARQPLLYVEGTTDCDYLRRAADLLGKTDVLSGFTMDAAGGEPRLKTIWNGLTKVPEPARMSVVLLFDPECNIERQHKGNIHKTSMPFFDGHPIPKGIENLFDRETLETARRHRLEFIDVDGERKRIVRGEEVFVPESWSVNEDEKRKPVRLALHTRNPQGFSSLRDSIRFA